MLKSKSFKVFRNTVLVGLAFLLSFSSPLAVSAISSTQLYEFAQNNILFYEPDGASDCAAAVSNGEYMGQQYSLTEDEIKGVARMAWMENKCNDEAFRTEVSLMANLYEKNGHGMGLTAYLTQAVGSGGWFATYKHFNGFVGENAEELTRQFESEAEKWTKIVKEVLLGGERNLPPQIIEHDCFGDIVWVEVNGVKTYAENPGGCHGTGLSDKSLYVTGQTKIHTVYQSENEYYVFYRFAGGENGCGDPFGYKQNNPPSVESYSSVTNTNANYAGAQVWSDAQLQTIQANRAVYEEAANMYGFPWQVLATLHQLETSLTKRNPASSWDGSKSEGVYQLHSWAVAGTVNYPTSDTITDAEFRQQTLDAAKFVSGMVGDLNNPDNVKKLFFRYNGTSSYYIEKAKAMGFTDAQAANGEGSAYVMNRYDERRDPTSANMDPLWKGRYTGDHNYDPESVSERFGAFVLYTALGGEGGNMYCTGGQGGKIYETAMSLAKLSDNNGTGWYVSGDRVPSTKYREALSTYDAQPTGYADWYENPGASCDQFVATVMIYSGADPNFPGLYPPTQRKYMLQHPEKYQQIVNTHDFSVLQPGDILVTLGDEKGTRHIFIYGGMRDSVPVQIGASNGIHTGYVYKFADGTWILNGYEYLIFRMIK